MTLKQESFYELASHFMVRIPYLESEQFYKLTECASAHPLVLDLYLANQQVQEAIATASSSLHRALENFPTLSPKKQEQTLSSLFKYIVRMATRPTPFGLFSFVSLGQWGDKTQLDFSSSQVRKWVRPDMEWLVTFLDRFVDDIQPSSPVLLTKHQLLQTSSNRIVLSYYRNKKENQEEVSFRKNALTDVILRETVHPISVADLMGKILTSIPGLDESKVFTVVLSLIRQTILLPEFLPNLLSENPTNNVLRSLERLFPDNPKTLTLKTIVQKIEKINQVPIGEGLADRQELEQVMRGEAQSLTPLQTDSFCIATPTLPREVAEELRTSIAAVWRLSSHNPVNEPLKRYHAKFLEKYGSFRTVPICELINDTLGIGFPDYASKAPESTASSWEDGLWELYFQALFSGEMECVLSDEFINQKTKQLPEWNLPTSFDVFFHLSGDSTEDIEKGNFYISLSPVSGGGDGGSTFGRFLYLFDKGQQEEIRQQCLKEQSNNPQYLFVEASYFPTSPRAANVAIHEYFREKELNLGYVGVPNDRSIILSDIRVGATLEQLYLQIDGCDKPLNIVSMNALNSQVGPPVLQLMREISRQLCVPFNPFNGTYPPFPPFRPRVRYRKTILSPASWRATLSLIDGKENDSSDVLMLKFKRWAQNWKLPRFVFMTQGDNRILLDTTNPSHLQEILHELKTGPRFVCLLTEKIGKQEWVKSDRGTHFAEFVTTCVKNTSSSSPFPPLRKRNDDVPFTIRNQLPGFEWVYLKLFLPSKAETFLLTHHIKVFIEQMQDKIKKWFFIRYVDDGRAHVRLRIRLDSPHQVEDVLGWAALLLESSAIQDYSICPYEREVERYGGIKRIDLVEDFFQADSELCLALLESKDKISFSDYVLATISLVEMLGNGGFSLDEQFSLFSKMQFDEKHLDGFRKWKPTILQHIANIPEKLPLCLPEALTSRRSQIVRQIASSVQGSELDSLILSLCHMHCNRLLGVDPLKEHKACLFAKKGLQTLKEQASFREKDIVCPIH